jgi:hypothetical protein
VNPFLVEIVGEGPAWWQAWLPLVGSTIVAAAAFTGVLLSNRTNRAAIKVSQRNVDRTNQAAEDREHNKWRRETTLSTVTQALEISSDVYGQLWQMGRRRQELTDEVEHSLRRTIDGLRRICNTLRVLSNSAIANDAMEIQSALNGAIRAAGQYLDPTSWEAATPPQQQKLLNEWVKSLNTIRKTELALIDRARIELGIELPGADQSESEISSAPPGKELK